MTNKELAKILLQNPDNQVQVCVKDTWILQADIVKVSNGLDGLGNKTTIITVKQP